MRHVALFLLLALPAHAATLAERVEELARPYLAGRWLQSACVGVIRDGRTEVVGLGSVRPGGRAPDARTIFEIGSVTKTMTAILAAQQSATGDFAIEDSVSPLLGGAKLPTHEGRAITVEDLLTHHSGLPTAPPELQHEPLSAYETYGAGQMMASLAAFALPRAPGAEWEYSNQGFALAGHLLAQRTGRSYARLLADRLFGPLEMTDSAVTLSAEQAMRFAPAFDEDGEPAEPWEPLVYDACGAVRSSVADMLRYVQAQIEPADSPLGRAIVTAAVPRRPTKIPGHRVGLAWMTEDSTGTVWHNGLTEGFGSYVAFRRSSKSGVVVLANSRGMAAMEIGRAALAFVNGETYAPAPLPPDLPAAAADYTGRYRFDDGTTWEVRDAGDHLRLQLGARSLRLRQTEPDVFYMRRAGAVLDFQREGGRVVSFKLYAVPGQPVAKRLPGEPAD